MTLSLATRGYLCSGRGGGAAAPCGPGPVITGSASLEPGVRGAAIDRGDVPTITGAGVPGPQISGSAGEQQEAAGDTPVISGGGVLSPEGSGK
jgi:hypothetical protein